VVVVEPLAEAVVVAPPVEVEVDPPLVVVLRAWPCGLVLRAVTVVARIRGAAFFAWPCATRCACLFRWPGGVFPPWRSLGGCLPMAGHAKATQMSAALKRAGTSCNRERGGATVTNFLIGKRPIARWYGRLPILSTGDLSMHSLAG
jgi:hypothetical protein